jgi:hypothetical protein
MDYQNKNPITISLYLFDFLRDFTPNAIGFVGGNIRVLPQPCYQYDPAEGVVKVYLDKSMAGGRL